ncbi:ATP-citrate synthase alpha chain protein 1 [Dionaea muscipula]
MARKKIREFDSKRLVKEHFKRFSGGIELPIKSAQITETTDLNEPVEKETWLSSEKMVVKPDMLFGKRGKSGLVALKLDFAQVVAFVKECFGKEVEISRCRGPITTFIVEPFVPHSEAFYLNIISERLGCNICFSECGGFHNCSREHMLDGQRCGLTAPALIFQICWVIWILAIHQPFAELWRPVAN